MMPRRQETDKAAPLYNVCDGSAIDLEIDSQIPSKVRSSLHNQATASVAIARKSCSGSE